MTAEFAVALPAVLLLLALLLAGAAAGATQLRLEEAALASARALARGEGPATAEAIVGRLAGASATAAIAADGEWVSVTVADRVAGPLGATVPWILTARASTRNEAARAQGRIAASTTALYTSASSTSALSATPHGAAAPQPAWTRHPTTASAA
ncbi:TadE family type IV pilus minor pilin [Arthrobacter sp. HS15c]|uniref:TadE family type IV pilus minor pilin n=1 Tax=Arthrobacter sp. HS15c TaxID=3230279 RepID=UPI00346753C0